MLSNILRIKIIIIVCCFLPGCYRVTLSSSVQHNVEMYYNQNTYFPTNMGVQTLVIINHRATLIPPWSVPSNSILLGRVYSHKRKRAKKIAGRVGGTHIVFKGAQEYDVYLVR